MGRAKGGKFGKGKSMPLCLKSGHLQADCRAKAANKPRIPRPVASLEEDEVWEDDLEANGLDCKSFEQQCDAMFCCQRCFDPVHEYDGDDADDGREWAAEPVSDRKPFLNQFKIHTPTSAASSQPSSWSSPNSGPPASPPRESFEDTIRRMQEELKMKLEAMKAEPLAFIEPPGFGGKQWTANASPEKQVNGRCEGFRLRMESAELSLPGLMSLPVQLRVPEFPRALACS